MGRLLRSNSKAGKCGLGSHWLGKEPCGKQSELVGGSLDPTSTGQKPRNRQAKPGSKPTGLPGKGWGFGSHWAEPGSGPGPSWQGTGTGQLLDPAQVYRPRLSQWGMGHQPTYWSTRPVHLSYQPGDWGPGSLLQSEAPAPTG